MKAIGEGLILKQNPDGDDTIRLGEKENTRHKFHYYYFFVFQMYFFIFPFFYFCKLVVGPG